jgi:hypothetical protein
LLPDDLNTSTIIFNDNDGHQTTDFYVGSSAEFSECYDVLQDNSLVTASCPSIPTGLTENVAKQNATLYPNPVENSLYTRTSGDVKIYTITGQCVAAFVNVLAHSPIDVSMLQSGIYLVNIIEDSGKVNSVKIQKR